MTAGAASLVIRSVYALCLGVACINHVVADIRYGPLLDGLAHDIPSAVRLYWSSLTLFDALAAALLFARPKAGLAMTLAIMLSDVIVNGWVAFHLDAGLTYPYLAQVAFLLFVCATFMPAWRGMRNDRSEPPSGFS